MAHSLVDTRRRPQETGNVTLELALVLPLLLLILAGTLDIGMLLWKKQILTNASREGARAAIAANMSGKPEKTEAQIRSLVQNYLTKFNFKDQDNNPLVLTSGNNFSYSTSLSSDGYLVSVELTQIPCRLMLIPMALNIFNFPCQGDLILLGARTTMAAQWTNPGP